LNVGDPIEHILKLAVKIPDARPRVLLDYNAGADAEVDSMQRRDSRLGQAARWWRHGQ